MSFVCRCLVTYRIYKEKLLSSLKAHSVRVQIILVFQKNFDFHFNFKEIRVKGFLSSVLNAFPSSSSKVFYAKIKITVLGSGGDRRSRRVVLLQKAAKFSEFHVATKKICGFNAKGWQRPTQLATTPTIVYLSPGHSMIWDTSSSVKVVTIQNEKFKFTFLGKFPFKNSQYFNIQQLSCPPFRRDDT